MPRPRPADLVAVVVAIGLAGAVTWLTAGGWPEWLFQSVALLTLVVVLRAGLDAVMRASAARRAARDLAATEPSEAARTAVRGERRRLSADITQRLRALLEVIADLADPDAPDPGVRAREIHQQAQIATSELRRQLGLLRADASSALAELSASPASNGAVGSAKSWRRRDLVIGGIVVVLALVESMIYPPSEGRPLLLGSVLLTGLAAAPLLIRSVAPGLAAAMMGACFLLGSAFHAPVVSGFWCFALGVVAWTIGVRRRGWWGAGLLIGGAVVGSYVADPDNLLILALILAVGLLAGLVVGRVRSLELSARRTAADRVSDLAAATTAAVAAERSAYAREIHDVVSHAIGLAALQAAAAQVSWPDHPAEARQALRVIGETAQSTLAEFDRLLAEAPQAASRHDLTGLVQRIGAAGTPVTLEQLADPGPAAEIVYRIVQESLTNVVRHSPGAAARVRITRSNGELTVQVVDDGGEGGARGQPGRERGYGLVGLAERVEFAGGHFTAGPLPDGAGFGVTAVLPVAAQVSS